MQRFVTNNSVIIDNISFDVAKDNQPNMMCERERKRIGDSLCQFSLSSFLQLADLITEHYKYIVN